MALDYTALQSWGVALRSMRANRPALAARGARARTFSAGLEQAEQLWRASEVVGSVASPLLLFYGLTQAGRAICAAGLEGSAWEGAHRHGLAFMFTPPANNALVDHLDNVMVRPNGRGLVHQVANVLQSPVLDSQVSLSELVGSLDSDLLFDECQIRKPKPLEVFESPGATFQHDAPAVASLLVGPLPEQFAAERLEVPPGPNNLAYTKILEPPAHEVAAWLGAYPKLRAHGLPTVVGTPEPSIGRLNSGDWLVRLNWDNEPHTSGLTQSDWTVQQLDVVYDGEVNSIHGVVLPAVDGNSEAQGLLICWWLVLYCLSLLARYYPTSWQGMLDVDESPLSVPLDHLISVARSKVPLLLYDALHSLRTVQSRSSTGS